MRKILILTERFYPEEFLINDLAQEWENNGYDVEVLTQVPSYPHDRVFDGYCNKLLQCTLGPGNIKVHRVKTCIGYNRSLIKKILNYISFAVLTTIWSLFKGWKYDRVFVYHTGPLTMASAAVVLHYICRKKCMIWTQDLWPDAVYAYGFKPSWWKRFLLNNFVRLIYSSCSFVSVSCPGFAAKLKAYTGKKVYYLPQWTLQSFDKASNSKTEKRKIFTFAGNIGSVQNLELVIEAFGTMESGDAELRIVGDGVNLNTLKELAAAGNYRNVVFYGRLPQKQMPEIFAQSDIMIISLKPELSMTVPAKFQAYIAAGKPIFGVIEGDTASLIQEHNLGVVSRASDLNDIQNGFRQCLNASSEQFKLWSSNALMVSDKFFDRNKIIAEFNEILWSE